MTPEQYAKASPIIEALRRVASARTSAQIAYDAFCAEEKKDLLSVPKKRKTFNVIPNGSATMV